MSGALDDPLEIVSALQREIHQARPKLDSINQLRSALFESLRNANEPLFFDILNKLIPDINHDSPQVGGIIALTCGAIVEIGGLDSVQSGIALVERATPLLQAAHRLPTLLEEVYPLTEDNEDEEPEDVALEVEGRQISREVANQLFTRDPQAVVAWQVRDLWISPLIAHLTRSAELRRRASAHSAFHGIVEQNASSGDWLRMALRVLDDTELLVLHPEIDQGYRLKMSGVEGNFQLHLLLADLLIARQNQGNQTEGLPGTPPSPRIADAVWGRRGPQFAEETAQGAWNLYDWRAAAHWEKIATNGGTKHLYCWVWGEGIPDDIPEFEGVRVLLLGDLDSQRYFDAGRCFEGLRPSLTIEETLSSATVQSWMARLRAAV